jgi:hypothetical protein
MKGMEINVHNLDRLSNSSRELFEEIAESIHSYIVLYTISIFIDDTV